MSLRLVIRIIFAGLALALAATVRLPTCHADDAKARARVLFNQGVAEYEAGEPRAALASFEAAYRLAPHPAVRINMANCFEQLGRLVESVFNYERFLEESGGQVTDVQRADVEAAIARLSRRIGTLIVSVVPDDAELRIDGLIPKRLPSGAVQLPTGRYEVTLTARGFLGAQRTVLVTGRQETRLSVTLESESESGPAVAAAGGAVTAERPAVDAYFAPSADASEAPEGRHRTWLWLGAGATAAFVLGFAVTGGLSLSAQQDFDAAIVTSNNPALSPLQREQARADGLKAADRADRLALASDVFLVGSVVAGGATLLWWLSDRNSLARASTRVEPLVLMRGGGGLLVEGTF